MACSLALSVSCVCIPCSLCVKGAPNSAGLCCQLGTKSQGGTVRVRKHTRARPQLSLLVQSPRPLPKEKKKGHTSRVKCRRGVASFQLNFKGQRQVCSVCGPGQSADSCSCVCCGSPCSYGPDEDKLAAKILIND